MFTQYSVFTRPDDETDREYGQLYILDSEEANESRNQKNDKLLIRMLQKLDDIKKNNSFC